MGKTNGNYLGFDNDELGNHPVSPYALTLVKVQAHNYLEHCSVEWGDSCSLLVCAIEVMGFSMTD